MSTPTITTVAEPVAETGAGLPASRRPRRRVGQERTSWSATVLLLLGAVTVAVPLYVTIVMSMKSDSQAVDGNAFSLPFPIDFTTFARAWELTDFPRAFAVSVFVSAVTVVGTIILSALASYAIVRNWDHRLFRWSFFYLLAAMFLPFPVVALAQIKMTGAIGLDNPLGVAILHVMFQMSFSMLLFTAFLRSLPKELEESAQIDGATTNQTFWRLVFPLLAPMSATVGIFAFLASWNDFMMPSLITSDPALQTLPVVQSLFQDQFTANYNVAFASYLMAMAPAIVVYLFTQRWVLSGVTQGAIK